MSYVKLDRRDFLRTAAAAAVLPMLGGCRDSTLAQTGGGEILDKLRANGINDPRNEWWGARDVPTNVSSHMMLRTAADKGDRLVIRGSVLNADDSPAPNTLIYFYHTDVHGIYGVDGQHRHGRYRGWVLTDEKGEYSFETIRPASYPNSTIAAHIHMTVTTVKKREDWIDSIVFEGDRFLTSRDRTSMRGGFDPVLLLKESEKGVFTGVRKIRLA